MPSQGISVGWRDAGHPPSKPLWWRRFLVLVVGTVGLAGANSDIVLSSVASVSKGLGAVIVEGRFALQCEVQFAHQSSGLNKQGSLFFHRQAAICIKGHIAILKTIGSAPIIQLSSEIKQK
jgi:hypothetical protein